MLLYLAFFAEDDSGQSTSPKDQSGSLLVLQDPHIFDIRELLDGSSESSNLSNTNMVEALSTIDPNSLKQSLLSLVSCSSAQNSLNMHVNFNSEGVFSLKRDQARQPLRDRSFDWLQDITVGVAENASPIPKEWEINLYDVRFMRRLGRGVAGTTYLGKWRGQKVAVKVSKMTKSGVRPSPPQ